MYSKYRAISELKWKDLLVYENWEHRYLKSIISHLLENMDRTFQSFWYFLFSYNSLSSWHQFFFFNFVTFSASEGFRRSSKPNSFAATSCWRFGWDNICYCNLSSRSCKVTYCLFYCYIQ